MNGLEGIADTDQLATAQMQPEHAFQIRGEGPMAAKLTTSPTLASTNPKARRGDDRGQIRTRQRVRDLAEVYTHKREVDAMLDLVPDMFPTVDDPSNTDRTFLEPACGSGNFLEEILYRKLAHVAARRYGRGERYEHRILRCLASIYGIDINDENVDESKARLRGVIASHLDNDLNTQVPSAGFASAVEVILDTNIQCANTLNDAKTIQLVEYHPGRAGLFTREWSFLEEPDDQMDLFGTPDELARDEVPVHYSQLEKNPDPSVAIPTKSSKAKGAK